MRFRPRTWRSARVDRVSDARFPLGESTAGGFEISRANAGDTCKVQEEGAWKEGVLLFHSSMRGLELENSLSDDVHLLDLLLDCK